MTLTPHPLLVLLSRKGRAIPLLPLWAVRAVQSFSACTRVLLSFTFLHILQRLCYEFAFFFRMYITGVATKPLADTAQVASKEIICM